MKIDKCKKEISFIYFDDAHTRENLVELIYQELLNYKIVDKILLILLIMQAMTM